MSLLQDTTRNNRIHTTYLDIFGCAMKQVILTLIVPLALLGQSSRVEFQTGPPPPPNGISGSVAGTGAQSTLFYWVIATYPRGDSQPAGPLTINNSQPVSGLSVTNFNRIRWNALGGATSYTVIRNTTNSNPLASGTCASCQIATGLTVAQFDDVGGATGSFTISTIPGVSGYWELNNRDFAEARYDVSPNKLTSFENEGVTFANLPNATAGTQIYCTDCIPGTPCTASGSGALAVFNGTQWECGGGGGSSEADISNPVHHFPLEQSSGTSVVNSGTSSSTLDLINTPTWISGAANCAVGDFCLDFNQASSEYGQVLSPTMPTGNMTLAGWHRIDVSDDTFWMISDGSGNNEMQLIVDGSRLLSTFIDNVQVVHTTSGAMTVSQWFHVAIVRQDGSYLIYVDGIPIVGGISTPATLDYSTCQLLVGTDNDTSGCVDSLGNFFDGRMDDLYVFNRALNQTDILALVALGN